ncbi:MAG: DedA family protein [Thermodesulfobacteriota bacterium]
MFEDAVNWLVGTIGDWGYAGVTILMFLESTFFPFPSEVVVVPAGYLASQNAMNIWLVILSGTVGSLLGAIFNYWLALRLGRPFFVKYGHYLFVSEKKLDKADKFFARHGHISTFIARLLPGIRQIISLPAGLARMNFLVFSLFTTLGAGIWVIILAVLGFWFGRNQDLIGEKINEVFLVLIPACAIIVVIYTIIHLRRKRQQ